MVGPLNRGSSVISENVVMTDPQSYEQLSYSPALVGGGCHFEEGAAADRDRGGLQGERVGLSRVPVTCPP